MREALHRCDPPCIPYLGMYLTDLSFIEEGTPDFTPDRLLNFSKMRMVRSDFCESFTFALFFFWYPSLVALGWVYFIRENRALLHKLPLFHQIWEVLLEFQFFFTQIRAFSSKFVIQFF